ncbi:metallophosphoesterase family protein [Phytoactinopolyspora halotolerans]|uniref:Metallophosphoesterase family protein n=1 Tax=Phytoactinopolyspora halotolerans TaxID=1981512 RepID=A0A6L9S431_9ACTN|nr:metallophosphoesterase family protein [Phytoactinopolyspora halotolerans]NED99782.1 metallophosphoesterase family protein [Phytoactinopolyspora halotolerans]
MVASVAVLSDVHGALPALEAVLAEPDVATVDRIVLTGDIAAGPVPVETLDTLVSLGERVVWVRGNADRELVRVAEGEPCDIDVSQWAGRQLRADQVELLRALEHPVRLDVDGFGPVVFCHGTPRDDDEVVLVDSSLARWSEVFGALDDDVHTVVCGHTHMPFQRLVDRRLVVNPGSVGMPYGRPGPQWALLRDGVVELRRTSVDLEWLAERTVAASGYPDVRSWVEDYVLAVASDAEAVTVFGPRDGRPSDG